MDRGGQDSYGRGRTGSSGGRGRGRSGGGGSGYGGGGRNGGGGGGSGYGRGRSGGGGGYDQNYESQYDESAGGRGGRGRGSHAGGYDDRATQQWSSHGGGAGGPVGRGAWNARPWGPSAPSSSTGQPQPQPQSLPSAGAWNARPWGPSAPSSSTVQPQPHHQSLPSADFVEPNLQTLKISEQRQVVSSQEKMGNRRPLRRPGRGTLAVRSVRLLANHFPVKFNPNSTILHYDVDVQQVTPHGNQRSKRTIPKHLMRLIKDKLCSEKPNFPADMLAYDGEKNIFSAVELPDGEFIVKLSDGEGAVAQTYKLTIKEVNQLKLSKLKEYLAGSLSYVPRDILQGMELVMKENPSKYRIPVNRSFYSNDYNAKDDLKCGVAAYRGFQQSLRPTSQGLALCLDYSVLAFRKPMPVLDYLREYLDNFRGVNDVIRMRDEVTRALKGLKVRVTHRITQQKYIISGLTKDSTRTLTFQLLDPDGQAPPRDVRIVDYFWEKYRRRIDHLDIPCLDVGKPGRQNCVPMEFCVLVEGQVYPKEELDRDRALFLKRISLAPPAERKNSICEMVQAEDGPCGIVAKNFGMEVEKNMTSLQGRVLGAPELKLRDANGRVCPIRVDREKCHWNLVGKSVVEGQHVERWALIDFTSSRLPAQEFIMKLRDRARNIGIKMEEPLGLRSTGMHEFSSPDRIEKLLRKVIAEAKQQLQIVVCVMARKDPGYKYLKWVSETQIGVVTQCCLSSNYSYQRGQDQYLANLCLKINAKVGGSNVELNERLPHFVHEDNVMFIGADVNHPAARNSTCPSIAAVVGTVNWPATNRYAARVQPQQHRKEKILNFGSICKDLINTFTQLNNSRPKKIVVFRDGVSEGQFDMVLNEELTDLMEAIYEENYKPTITLVVAQKRHHTRMFNVDGGVVGNVPPGTVVDTTIVHPFEFDFYLCSHYGSLGTSKPTHYYVLYDDNGFTSDKLQKLIYDLCYTYARCTKPVSLVPPVYYADLVAYRGRLFQEVVMEQSPASSKMSSAASSSSSADSFDQNFYTLHPDLQNKMFFV